MRKENSGFNKSILWTILCVSAIVILLVTALVYRDFFGTILSGEHSQTPPVTVVQGDDISNLLPAPESSPQNAESSEIISVTKENLRTVIASIAPYDAFSWSFVVTTHSSGGALEEQNKLVFNNGIYELNISVGDKEQRTVIDNGSTVTVTEHFPFPGSYTFPSDYTDVFSQGRLATPENFLNLPEDTVDFSCKLSKGIYGNTANLDFSYFLSPSTSADSGNTNENSLLYRESYKISLDYGLVVSAQTYENDVLIYKLETLSLKNSIEEEAPANQPESDVQAP